MSDLYVTAGGIIRLVELAPVQHRLQVAEWIGWSIANTALSPSERRTVEELLEALCHDAEVSVRQALCAQVLPCPRLPSSVVQALAHDVESVSIPFIRHSESLTDADMLRVIGGDDTLRQISVARRGRVSEQIAHALIECRKVSVVKMLIANSGASIREPDFLQVLNLYGEMGSMATLVAKRSDLPAEISYRVASSRSAVERDKRRDRVARPAELAGGEPHWLSRS